MKNAVIGKGLDRIDARLKVTGKAQYAAEIPTANVVYGVIVGANGGRGKITTLDTDAAEKAPGILSVLSHKNAPKLPGAAHKEPGVDRVMHLFQDAQVYYSDQPIAFVIGDTLEHATYGASLVKATIEQGDSLALDAQTLANSGKAAPPKTVNGKKPDTSKGDFDAAFSQSSVKVQQLYTTPDQTHNPMEMHATMAVWQGDDKLTVYDSTQGIFGVQKKVGIVFGLAPDNVRVISHYVGGGFGSKGSPWSHIGLAVMGAKVTGRAVRVMVTRNQMFGFVGHRPLTKQTVTLGADATGKLLAVRHESLSYTSTIDDFIEPSSLQTRMLYACDNVETTHRLVKLDLSTPTFMRAPGESTGTFALESAMDELAYALKMDPLALRLKNYAERDPDEDKPWSSKELRACYQKASEKFGWAKRNPNPRSTRDGRWLVGVGMATATYPANQPDSSAAVHIRLDGTALVQAGSQDIGTGTYTIMTQIAADTLGIAYEQVTFELGDTKMPPTPVSGGSSTASGTGSAVKKACLQTLAELVQLATSTAGSPLQNAAPANVDIDSGTLFLKSDPTKRITIGDVVKQSGKNELLVRADNKSKEDRKTHSCHSFGAQFVEVGVDEVTSEVRVRRVVSAFAAGRILNAKTAESQFFGGIVWGIGFALTEHTARDTGTGRVVNRSLQDYHVPVNADVPDIDVIMVEEDDPYVNEIGAKGIGEIGITGIVAAIANAVFHATGKRIRDLPITPDKLL